MSKHRATDGALVAGSVSESTGSSSGLARAGLAYLLVTTLVVGVWAHLAPRAFYDNFPGLSFAWIVVDGPYNEHLLRDVGGGYLAVAAVALMALMRPSAVLVRAAAVTTLVAQIPHLLYHIETIALLPTALEQTLQTVSLASLVIIPVLLLWATMTPRDQLGVE